MSTIHICDKCGRTSATIVIKSVAVPYSGRIGSPNVYTADLCDACLENLVEWMKTKTPLDTDE